MTMARIPLNYPTDSSNEKIIEVINELSREIIDSGANINLVLQLSPVISLGQIELQKRILENNRNITSDLHTEVSKLSKITEQNSISSKKYARASTLISIMALTISFIALGISIYFSIQDNKETEQWRSEEINLLQNILKK